MVGATAAFKTRATRYGNREVRACHFHAKCVKMTRRIDNEGRGGSMDQWINGLMENPLIHQSINPLAAPQMSQLGLAKYTTATQRLT